VKIVENVNTPFYLTGGTALGRVYLNHRYSDDLDFFQNASPGFVKDCTDIIDTLKLNFPNIKVDKAEESFARIIIEENTDLKVEFVNDVKYHAGDVAQASIFNRIDDWRNILSNKIFALSRDAPKDLADLLFLSYTFSFSWKSAVDDAKNKDMWVNEIDASKIIYEFDQKRFSKVKWIDEQDADFSVHLKTMARDLLHGFDNSLYSSKNQ
jgi:hypothetical protein